MHIAVHLRGGRNLTNVRSEAIAQGMEAAGHKVTFYERCVPSARTDDLTVQTGFGRTPAIMEAIERGKPYLIMEAPFWRGDGNVHTTSSFGYNGLAGGAFRPAAPSSERPHPPLRSLKTEGSTIIFGQKPTDHSLRGHNHARWITAKITEHPGAEFRPHPLMVPEGSLETLESALERCLHAITFSSTVGAEALINGCISLPECPGSTAYQVTDRESWIHELSWGQFSHLELISEEVANHVLSGFAEGRERARDGLQEIPREKLDGTAIQREYNRTLLCQAITS